MASSLGPCLTHMTSTFHSQLVFMITTRLALFRLKIWSTLQKMENCKIPPMFSTKNIWANENISTVRKESLRSKCSLKHDAIKEEAKTFRSINAANFKTSNCRGSIHCNCAQPFNKPCRYHGCPHREIKHYSP